MNSKKNIHQHSDKELKLFGILLSVVIIFWCSIALWKHYLALQSALAIYAVALLLAIISIIKPRFLTSFHHYWLRTFSWLNKIITWTSLAVAFFLIITPTAIIKRALGSNPVHSPQTMPDSYRQISKPLPRQDMEHPY